jgi:tetratricopeptide (TPR) repeat protein
MNNGAQTVKPTIKLIVFIFTFLTLAASADAQSPREQLQQMVEQLQKNLTDSVLRERIIKLGAEMKPAQAIPEEAVRRMARGTAAFKSATSSADFHDAVKEFEQAVLAAPWFADAYFNLGVAQDKAGNYEAALRSLKLAQLAALDSREIKELIYEVEYRRDKALAAPRAPDLARLQGAWVQEDGPLVFYFQMKMTGDSIRFSAERYVSSDSGSHTYPVGFAGEYRLKAANEEFNGVYVEGTQGNACGGRESPASARISPDGREMTVVLRQMFGLGTRASQVDPTTCVQRPKPEYRFVMRKQ